MTVVYPAKDAAKFDWDYYTTKHFELVGQTLKDHGMVAAAAQQCAPGPDGASPPYVAVATIDFESAEKFQAAFPTAAPVLMGDIPNFTDIEPVITVGPIHA
jgi:uncharacterized protein (TIGR02118 family)